MMHIENTDAFTKAILEFLQIDTADPKVRQIAPCRLREDSPCGFSMHTNNSHREGRAFPALGLARAARPAIVATQVILGPDKILNVSRQSRSQCRHAC
jgi:hypothetical protein